jgi:hypothetical protein
VSDLEASRTMLRDELAPIRDQLARIEEKLGLILDLLFLYDSAVAQEVVQALRKAAAKPRGAYGAARRSWQAATADVRGRTILSSCSLPRRPRLCCGPAAGDDVPEGADVIKLFATLAWVRAAIKA